MDLKLGSSSKGAWIEGVENIWTKGGGGERIRKSA
jgi:hypothetical protein